MLVLTRKQNEKIRIGDSITITVLRMKGKAVRLGIEAPHDISVIRGELCFDQENVPANHQSSEVEQSAEVPPKSKAITAVPRRNLANEATSHWPVASLGTPKTDLSTMAKV